jgi:hypothetical protein
MASRRGAKSVNISDVELLLRKGKQIRKKYKALKEICDRSKDGKVVAPTQIRKLADELKKAIDDAHTPGPQRRLPVVRPRVAPPFRIAMAEPILHTETVSRLPPPPGLGRRLLGFLANRLSGGRL